MCDVCRAGTVAISRLVYVQMCSDSVDRLCLFIELWMEERFCCAVVFALPNVGGGFGVRACIFPNSRESMALFRFVLFFVRVIFYFANGTSAVTWWWIFCRVHTEGCNFCLLYENVAANPCPDRFKRYALRVVLARCSPAPRLLMLLVMGHGVCMFWHCEGRGYPPFPSCIIGIYMYSLGAWCTKCHGSAQLYAAVWHCSTTFFFCKVCLRAENEEPPDKLAGHKLRVRSLIGKHTLELSACL